MTLPFITLTKNSSADVQSGIVQKNGPVYMTNAGRRTKIAVVTEFAGNAFDGLVPSAAEEMAKRFPCSQVILISGVLKKYLQGGLRPTRVLNYCIVHARVLLCFIRERPQIFLVDTTPPLTQWWTGILAALFKAKVYVWLMDYHPEIEARYFEGVRGLSWLATLLRAIDRKMLRLVSGIVVLDGAMERIIRFRCNGAQLKLHPPWSTQGTGRYEPVRLNEDEQELRLTYIGNLGNAHPLDDLERLLATVALRRKIRILYVGGNPDGLERMRRMAQRLGADFQREKRLGWEELRGKLNVFRPNYGIVTLDQAQSGLVSPCKYATYTLLGLPILYVGPLLTNADAVCRVLGAGMAVTHEELAHDTGRFAQSLVDPGAREQRRLATKTAHEWQSKFNESSFVDLIEPWLKVAPQQLSGAVPT